MKDNIRCTIIIPSLNPNNKLLELVNSLLESGFKDIIVINDGSALEYDAIYNVLPKQVKLLKHDVNKGKGAAIKTALKELKNTDAFWLSSVNMLLLYPDVLKFICAIASSISSTSM